MKVSMPILLVLLGLNVQAAEEATSRDGDLNRLQGRWTAKAGARHEIHVVIEIKGRGVLAAIKTPQGLDFQVQGEVKLDETTSPRSLDWKKLTGPDQQPLPEIAAVYKIDGDTFTVCNGGFLGARPKEFKPGEAQLGGDEGRRGQRDAMGAQPLGGFPGLRRVPRRQALRPGKLARAPPLSPLLPPMGASVLCFASDILAHFRAQRTRAATFSRWRGSQWTENVVRTVCFQRWISSAILAQGPTRATSSTILAGTAAMALFLSPAR